MRSFFAWVRAVFSDSRGEPSSKRTISIIAFILLGTAFMLNLFMDFTIDEFMWDGMITLVIFGIGFVASEKFTGILRKKGPYDEDDYYHHGHGHYHDHGYGGYGGYGRDRRRRRYGYGGGGYGDDRYRDDDRDRDRDKPRDRDRDIERVDNIEREVDQGTSSPNPGEEPPMDAEDYENV